MSRRFAYEGQEWVAGPTLGSHDAVGLRRLLVEFSCPSTGDRVPGLISPVGIERMKDEQLVAALRKALAKRRATAMLRRSSMAEERHSSGWMKLNFTIDDHIADAGTTLLNEIERELGLEEFPDDFAVFDVDAGGGGSTVYFSLAAAHRLRTLLARKDVTPAETPLAEDATLLIGHSEKAWALLK